MDFNSLLVIFILYKDMIFMTNGDYDGTRAQYLSVQISTIIFFFSFFNKLNLLLL